MPPKQKPMSEDEADISVPTFKTQTLEELFEACWQNKNTKITDSALHLSTEYLRLFTIEAIHRTAEVAKQEGEQEALEVKHFEAVAPSLVLDF